MDLKTWLDGEEHRRAKLVAFLNSAVAVKTGSGKVTHAQISGWVADPNDANGRYRPIPVPYALAIEKFTKGEVKRWDSCPRTWFVVWPELKRRADAPEIAIAPEEQVIGS